MFVCLTSYQSPLVSARCCVSPLAAMLFSATSEAFRLRFPPFHTGARGSAVGHFRERSLGAREIREKP